ncbi:MAG: hypothetical protein HW414_848 [Dehalococcoidia bacterium]|nr:hypothetical protein [Dehalococcoidia bacterium]
MLQIVVEAEICDGCGVCVEGCFVSCLALDEATGTARVVNEHGCLVCRQCEVGCPLGAIRVDLPNWPRDPTQGISTIL